MKQVDPKQVAQEEVRKMRGNILSAFLELSIRDGIMPLGLLENHVSPESRSVLQMTLRQMEKEGLVQLVYGEGYEPSVKLALRAKIPLVQPSTSGILRQLCLEYEHACSNFEGEP